MSQNTTQSETVTTAPVDLVANLETDMRDNYLKALRFIESKSQAELGSTSAPPEDSETFDAQMVVIGLLELVDQIANYSSALHQLLTFPAAVDIGQMKAGILQVFESETKFCNTINDLAKNEILSRCGVDANDKVAVQEFFKRQVDNTLITAPKTTE